MTLSLSAALAAADASDDEALRTLAAEVRRLRTPAWWYEDNEGIADNAPELIDWANVGEWVKVYAARNVWIGEARTVYDEEADEYRVEYRGPGGPPEGA
jgi:hypothetical protein